MARQPRAVVPGVPVHFVQRGNNRAVAFRDGADFASYRDALLEASREYGCAIHAYVLMSNHVHLLVTPGESTSLSRMMQYVGPRFVRAVNRRYGRTGTLWEGRYRSSLVDSERYVLTCARYIELNPVRAGMVGTPREYRWSSHRHNAYGECDSLVTHHSAYLALGRRAAERRGAYRALFDRPVEPLLIDAIRRAVRRGDITGDAAFREHVELALGCETFRLPHGGDRRSTAFLRAREP
jgi:putative transposase